MNSFKVIYLCILSLTIVGCASLRSTAKKYDTRLTTRVHTGTNSTAYSNLGDVYNRAQWPQQYAGDFVDSEYYYYETWLRFRPAAKINCTLYNRLDPYNSKQGSIDQLYGRQTVTFDTTYNITSDLQIRNAFRQHIYQYGFFNPPWSVNALRKEDYGRIVANYNGNSKNIQQETSLGFTLNKRNSNITANITMGRRGILIYPDLDMIPDPAQWSRRYEGNFIRNNYVNADARWGFTFSPKFRGDISGNINPAIWNSGASEYGNTRVALNTYYKLNPNWELQAGFSQNNYTYGSLNPYNPVSYSEWDWYRRIDPTLSETLRDLRAVRKRVATDYWIGFDLRP